jgi:hypothetical protein
VSKHAKRFGFAKTKESVSMVCLQGAASPQAPETTHAHSSPKGCSSDVRLLTHEVWLRDVWINRNDTAANTENPINCISHVPRQEHTTANSCLDNIATTVVPNSNPAPQLVYHIIATPETIHCYGQLPVPNPLPISIYLACSQPNPSPSTLHPASTPRNFSVPPPSTSPIQ